MKKLVIPFALLLSACGTETAPVAEPAKAEAKAAAPAAPVAAASARLVEEKGELVEFTYGWPAEAAALPALAERLEADMAKQRAEALATAREDKELGGPDIPFHGHFFSKRWQSAGETPRLLSLWTGAEFFTGGAHGNMVYEAILWDREANRAIAIADLFTDPSAAFAALDEAYCAGLDAERVKRREEPLPAEGEDWLIGCPALAKQVIAPVDADGNGRFELLRVLIPPYEAGSYAEGTYEVDVPVTDAIRETIRPNYRAAF